ncbi:hypothetical protein M747DRAFT_5199 [Aspergillus niger ATCC 13496]|uniref:Uncharacterized protein n=1 Tax=Aspergillus niger ATCC 13496 TaxID=1353008 RepID=A0A370CG67_ASPNG|nr:hypothetical protein M747DRAFT_5199 [Aspergillus niger ATCC 13496]
MPCSPFTPPHHITIYHSPAHHLTFINKAKKLSENHHNYSIRSGNRVSAPIPLMTSSWASATPHFVSIS